MQKINEKDFYRILKNYSLRHQRDDLIHYQNKILEYEQNLEYSKKSRNKLLREKSRIETIIDNEKILKQSKQIPFVKQIITKKDMILIITKDLIVKKLNLGPYCFCFSERDGMTVERIKGPIKVNLEEEDDEEEYIRKYHHPFIEVNGSVCYGGGDLEDQIFKSKKEGRIDLILILTWELLTNFNVGMSSPFVEWETFKHFAMKKKKKKRGKKNEHRRRRH